MAKIDPSTIQWDAAPAIDPASIKWDAPAAPKEEHSLLENIVGGAVKGASRMGVALLTPVDAAARKLGIQNDWIGRTDRAESIDQFLAERADPDSLAFKGADIGTQVAGTAGVGNAIAVPLKAAANVAGRFAPALNNLAAATASGGFKAGTATGLPGVVTRALGGGAAAAGATALTNPEATTAGAIAGAVLPVGLQAGGKVAGAVGRSLSIGNANRDLASRAVHQYGIPLGVGDVAEGGTLRAVRSILNDAPFSGGIGAAQREATQEGFNRAVGETFGAPEPKLSADVLQAARSRMGDEFDRIWGGNALQVDGPMMGRLLELQQTAAKMPRNEGASLLAEINDLLGKVQTDDAGNAIIPGDVANKFQSYLRRRAEGSAGMKHELGDLRQSIIAAFNRSVSPDDAAALTANRAQYKAFKTVEPLLNSAEAGVAGRMPGDVPAALLPQAVARSYSQAADLPLTELAQIGSRFLVDRTPRTGGSMRAALQNTAIGGALVGGGLSNPLLAAASIPVAAGVNAALGSPAIARKFLANPAQNAGGNAQAQQAIAELMERLSQSAYRAAPVLAAPALSSSP